MSRKTSLLFTAMVMLEIVGIATAAAQTLPTQFKDFRTFMQETRTTPAASYVGSPGTKVRDAAALEEMRQHILQMYANTSVVGSFVLDNQTFDCVPVMQQPSVRLGGITQLASPPPLAVAPGGPGAQSSTTAPQVSPGLNFDAHGNLIGCTSGHVPIRRLTLEEMSGFETLGNFFQKGPNGAGQAKPSAPANMPSGTNTQAPCQPAPDGSCHSHAWGQQYVTNYGVNSNIELWNPSLNGGVFSLSQLWVVNDTGAKSQTIESGWQVNPLKYNTSNGVLFIYWTADGYNKTGCYNLECTGFVQVNNTIHLGAGFNHYSSIAGSQESLWSMSLQWKLYQGNWWMFYGTTAVGYYPGQQYARSNGHGQSDLSTVSDLIQFGGETVGISSGSFYYFPQMGNGDFSYNSLAAQQNTIYYAKDRNGDTAWSNLTAEIDSPANCYASTIVKGTTISFGGPGGKKLPQSC
jgi:hypothetical protein